MTFVGKILVILIMALSLVFLGISTVAFTTATNWREETKKQQAEVSKLRGTLTTTKATEEDTRKKFEDAKKDNEAATKNYDATIASLRLDAQKSQEGITAAQTALTDAQANAKLALEEVKNKAGEAAKLRDQLSAAIEQSNQFKIQQTELNVEILNLKRMLQAAANNEKSLRELSGKQATVLTKMGISAQQISQASSAEAPPNVEGKILKVDDKNTTVEISIGQDDGLQVGQELYLFRTAPQAEYLGKLKITLVEPDQAVAKVIGNTVHGKKIKEGDDVASTIRSR